MDALGLKKVEGWRALCSDVPLCFSQDFGGQPAKKEARYLWCAVEQGGLKLVDKRPSGSARGSLSMLSFSIKKLTIWRHGGSSEAYVFRVFFKTARGKCWWWKRGGLDAFLLPLTLTLTCSSALWAFLGSLHLLGTPSPCSFDIRDRLAKGGSG